MPFPHYPQHDAMDCGPTCLRMVARHHGKHYNLEMLRERSHITREGVSMLGISRAGYSGSFCASDFGRIVPVISVQTVPFFSIKA